MSNVLQFREASESFDSSLDWRAIKFSGEYFQEEERLGTTDQNTEYQKDALLKAYPNAIVREEKKSGTTTKNRDVLNLLLDMIDKGDKLVVWKCPLPLN